MRFFGIGAKEPHGEGSTFTKFTEHARKMLSLAQQGAALRNQSFIGPQHLLLGMLHVEECAGLKVLQAQAIGSAIIQLNAVALVDRGLYDWDRSVKVGLTTRARRVIELSVYVARSLNHSYLGTEHFLLALVSEGDDAGALTRLGLTYDVLYAAILARAGEAREA
ncbi:MAG TPA: Clp protease N-terminal domain-containing protein [Ktedonobacterales bacterium]|nr:Clp protease N-terminal domain-containing protein [Ktedonobacterales bacterium]